MYFCAFQFLFHKKEIILKESRASQIEIYYQNDSITNQHNMVYRSPFTLEKQTSCITQYYSVLLKTTSSAIQLQHQIVSYFSTNRIL